MSAIEAQVDFIGEVTLLGPEDEFVFGRGAEVDLEIDNNPALHRRLGRLFCRSGMWWLYNEGSRLSITAHDRQSSSALTLASGCEAPVSWQETVIRISTHDASYEILLDLRDAADRTDAEAKSRPPISDLEVGNKTVEGATAVGLEGDDRLLLTVLAENKLRNPHAPLVLPANKAVAYRLDWTIRKYNRRLDRICFSFSEAGLRGVVGTVSEHAANRRHVLIEHAVRSGEVTVADLALLDEYPPK